MVRRLLLILVLMCFCVPVFSGNLLLVKPSGQDYKEVGPGDPYYDKMVRIVNSSPELQQVVLNYERTQLRKKAKLVKRMKENGTSSRKIKLVLKNYSVKPMVINLTSNSGGSSMGVKDFVITRLGQGNSRRKMKFTKTPMIKVAMNGETVKSGDIPDLVRSVSHEAAHCVMANEYRGTFPASKHYGKSHWRNMVSDGGLALAEGWAEMNGPYFSQDKDFIEPVSNGDYAFHNNKEDLKTYDEMLNTEGVVASVFWDIANTVPNGYDKCLEVFEHSRPNDMGNFLEVFKLKYPDDRSAIFKIMTVNTLGANISSSAEKVYSDFRAGSLSKGGYIEWLNDTMQQEWVDLGNTEEVEAIVDHSEVTDKQEDILEFKQPDTIREIPESGEKVLYDPGIFNKRGR